MAIAILFIYKRIVVDKVLITCVIRRININYINLSCISVSKSSKSIEVITFYQHMIRRTFWRRIQTLGGILNKNRKLVLHFIPCFLRTLLPHKSITLLIVDSSQQVVLQIFINLKLIYLLAQSFQIYFLCHIGVS